jgi:hypothetical protein
MAVAIVELKSNFGDSGMSASGGKRTVRFRAEISASGRVFRCSRRGCLCKMSQPVHRDIVEAFRRAAPEKTQARPCGTVS